MENQPPNSSGPPDGSDIRPQNSEPTPPERRRLGGFLGSFGRREQPPAYELPVADGGGAAGGAGGGGNGPENPNGPDKRDWWKLSDAEWKRWSWIDFEKNPLFKPLVTMMVIDALPVKERQEHLIEFNQACEEWKGAAFSDKFNKHGKEVADADRKLEEYDQTAINRVTDPETKEKLIDLLSRLDQLVGQKEDWQPRIAIMGRDESGVEVPIGKKSKPDLWTEEQWDEQWKRFRELEGLINAKRDQVQGMTSATFLTERDAILAEIKQAKVNETQKKIEEENDQSLELQIKHLELVIDRRLHGEILPTKEGLPERPFNEVVREFEQLERLKEGGETYDNEAYERVKADLERYFYEARNLGLFKDIEEGIEDNFEKLANEVMLTPRGNLKTKAVFTREVIKNLLNNPREDAVLAERSEAWDFHIMRGVSQAILARFQSTTEGNGIRGVFIKRAYRQMYQALYNLPKDVKLAVLEAQLQKDPSTVNLNEVEQLRGEVSQNRIKRISHEWDASSLEQRYALNISEREITKPEERMYDEDEFRIQFTGTSLEAISTGVNQFVYDVLYGTGAYDLDRIINRMRLLGTAIGRMTENVKVTERITLEQATQKLNEIRWPAENAIWMHIRHYLQTRLMAAEDARAAKEWGKEDTRLPALLTQESGLGGLEMYELLDSRANLFFSPVGFRGQFLNDKVSQYFLRDKIKELHIQKLMRYEFAGGNLQELTNCKSFDEFKLKFKLRGRGDDMPAKKLYRAENEAKETININRNLFEEDQQGGVKVRESASTEQLIAVRDQLRRARENLTVARAGYTEVRQKAKSAFEFAIKTYDVLGISAEIGDTTEIMANGDHIKTEHFVMALKYAIIEAGKSEEFKNKKAYGLEDNLTLMRKRGAKWVDDKGEQEAVYRMWAEELDINELIRIKDDQNEDGSFREWAEQTLGWIALVQKEGKDEFANFIKKARQELTIISQIKIRVDKKDSRGKITRADVNFNLQEGLEDTGITTEQWRAVERVYQQLQMNGSNATIAGKSLAEITNMEHLRPASNTFLAAYGGTRDNVNNPRMIREAEKGNQPWIRKLREKLALTGREEFTGSNYFKTDDEQEVLNLYTDAIAENMSFDIEVRKIANFLSTRERDGFSIKKINNQKEASTSRNTIHTNTHVDLGFPGQSWLRRRVAKLKRFYDKNERLTTGRFVEINNFFPLYIGSLPRELGASDIFEAVWNRDKDHYDDYVLSTFTDRELDIWTFNVGYLGAFDEREHKKEFGYSDKPLHDGDKLAVIPVQIPEYRINVDIGQIMAGHTSTIDSRSKDGYVGNLIERDFRFMPLVTAVVKRLEVDSAAGNSGLGDEQGQKLHYRHLKTLLSRGKPGERRLAEGLVAYGDVAQYMAMASLPGSFSPGLSFVGRKWEKERPLRNAGLPSDRRKPISAKAA